MSSNIFQISKVDIQMVSAPHLSFMISTLLTKTTTPTKSSSLSDWYHDPISNLLAYAVYWVLARPMQPGRCSILGVSLANATWLIRPGYVSDTSIPCIINLYLCVADRCYIFASLPTACLSQVSLSRVLPDIPTRKCCLAGHWCFILHRRTFGPLHPFISRSPSYHPFAHARGCLSPQSIQ